MRAQRDHWAALICQIGTVVLGDFLRAARDNCRVLSDARVSDLSDFARSQPSCASTQNDRAEARAMAERSDSCSTEANARSYTEQVGLPEPTGVEPYGAIVDRHGPMDQVLPLFDPHTQRVVTLRSLCAELDDLAPLARPPQRQAQLQGPAEAPASGDRRALRSVEGGRRDRPAA